MKYFIENWLFTLAAAFWVAATISLMACATDFATIHKVHKTGLEVEYRKDIYDCTQFAWANYHRLKKAGYNPYLQAGKTGSGESHLVTVVIDKTGRKWILDQRFPEPTREYQDFTPYGQEKI